MIAVEDGHFFALAVNREFQHWLTLCFPFHSGFKVSVTGFMVIKVLYSFLPVVESITNKCRTKILAEGEKLV